MCVGGWVEPRALVRPEGLCQWKINLFGRCTEIPCRVKKWICRQNEMHELGKMRKVHGNYFCKPEGEMLLGPPIRRRRDNVEGKLQELRYRRKDRVRVAGDRETRMCCCDDRVMNSRHHKWRMFLDQLSNFGYPKDSAGCLLLRHTNMAGMRRQEQRRDKRKRIRNNKKLPLCKLWRCVREVEVELHTWLESTINGDVSFTAQLLWFCRRTSVPIH